jgi:transposase
MEVKTILNRCHPIQGFVYVAASFGSGQQIDVEIRPRKRSQPICARCGLKGPTYDTARVARAFDFIPLLGFAVVLWHCMRRVNCHTCGVTVEKVPWATGKHHACIAYQQFLAFWAKKLAWTDVARTFHTSWKVVYHAVCYVVTWGLQHRDLDHITAIGIDEIAVWSGHKYLTVVYQINEGMRRLLWVGYGRTTASCTAFFRHFGRARSEALEFISSDMWRACINVVARWAPQAVHVLDRFHIVSRLNDAVDRVRRDERRALARDGFEPIKNSRWCFLKRPEDLTPAQNDKLRELLRYNLRCVRAYLAPRPNLWVEWYER